MNTCEHNMQLHAHTGGKCSWGNFLGGKFLGENFREEFSEVNFLNLKESVGPSSVKTTLLQFQSCKFEFHLEREEILKKEERVNQREHSRIHTQTRL